jgi:carboxypeptidase C (cathepsin A)
VNILYIDAPLGAGLSRLHTKYYNKKLNMMDEAQGLVDLLKKFFVSHKNFAGRDLIFGGESYGTMIATVMAYKIESENQLPNNKIIGLFQASNVLDIRLQSNIGKTLYQEKRITQKRYNQIKPLIS